MAITKEGKAIAKAIRNYMDLTPAWLGNMLEIMNTEALKRANDSALESAEKQRYKSQAVALSAIIKTLFISANH